MFITIARTLLSMAIVFMNKALVAHNNTMKKATVVIATLAQKNTELELECQYIVSGLRRIEAFLAGYKKGN